MLDELADATPTCPTCLHRLDAVGHPGQPFWWCSYERIAVMTAAVTR